MNISVINNITRVDQTFVCGHNETRVDQTCLCLWSQWNTCWSDLCLWSQCVDQKCLCLWSQWNPCWSDLSLSVVTMKPMLIRPVFVCGHNETHVDQTCLCPRWTDRAGVRESRHLPTGSASFRRSQGSGHVLYSALHWWVQEGGPEDSVLRCAPSGGE